MSRDTFKYADCPVERSMASIGTKWKPIVVWTLRHRKARFGQIVATIGLISKKVLTDTLRELEEDGIVIREEFRELPPRVEYSLTEKGAALLPIIQQLYEWEMRFPTNAEQENKDQRPNRSV